MTWTASEDMRCGRVRAPSASPHHTAAFALPTVRARGVVDGTRFADPARGGVEVDLAFADRRDHGLTRERARTTAGERHGALRSLVLSRRGIFWSPAARSSPAGLEASSEPAPRAPRGSRGWEPQAAPRGSARRPQQERMRRGKKHEESERAGEEDRGDPSGAALARVLESHV